MISPWKDVLVRFAAITGYFRQGGFNNTCLFFTVLMAGKSKVKVLLDLVLGMVPLPGVQVTAFSLHPYAGERASELTFSSSFKDTNLIMGVPPS